MALSMVVLGVAATGATASAAPDTRPPRIVTAAMQDRDGDGRADRLRLTYSERVRHRADRDGRYPFRIAGYRVRSVGAAAGRTVVLTLVERRAPDSGARPTVRYRRTRAKPVTDAGRNQARAQVFRKTRAHGKRPRGTGLPLPPVTPTPTPVTPRPNPAPGDRDGDGVLDGQDCGPGNPAIRPGAPDLPDLAFVDANCDGIDGTATDAVFVSPQGKDDNPGTRGAPKREIGAAVVAAAATGRYVLAAAGDYRNVDVTQKVGVYGGYDATNWSRRSGLVTSIVGYPEGIRVEGASDVVLQLLRVRGGADVVKVPEGASFYGIRAINAARLTLQRVSVTTRAGEPGAAGTDGADGRPGSPGADGGKGQCGGGTPGRGGAGGDSPNGRLGGAGGDGGEDTGGATGTGRAGMPGLTGTSGGSGGPAGDPGRDGATGDPGTGGAHGRNGQGGVNSLASFVGAWNGVGGSDGTNATSGNGGGGGGGGGGQVCTLCNNGAGNAGGGGGGGGEGGSLGAAGGPGGGSFGLFLYNSTATVLATSSVVANRGGAGGNGGDGGLQGAGGAGGLGATYCRDEIGEGGNGGSGGPGGHGGGGGGGTGGPSIGIVVAGTSAVTGSADSTVGYGNPGPGGAGGAGGASPAGAGDRGIAAGVYRPS